MDLTLETVTIQPVVEEVFGTARPLAEQNKNELALDFPEGIGSVHADNMRLRQVLLNLLATPASSPRTARSARRYARGGGRPALGRFRRLRHRYRHDRGAARPPLPGIRAGRRLDHPPIRRDRARPRDQPQALPDDGRRCDGDERAGQGIDLYRASAGAGGGADVADRDIAAASAAETGPAASQGSHGTVLVIDDDATARELIAAHLVDQTALPSRPRQTGSTV